MDKLPIITFLWRRNRQGHQLPNVCDYTATHVNKLHRGLKKHLHIEHELICITDMPDDVECRTLPLWDTYTHLGGCYNRLYIFSEDMKNLIGPRFACMDLDCVILNDVTPIFSRTEPFLIHKNAGKKKRQKYNGSFIMMDSGAHSFVWDSFDETLVSKIQADEERVGTDQAWISMCLEEAITIGPEDGVYEANKIKNNLPENARMIFFSGRRDPTERKFKWVKGNY